MPRLVDKDSCHYHQSFDYLLVVGGYSKKIQAIVEQTDNQHSYNRQQDAAHAPSQTGPTDYNCCDGIQFISDTSLR